MSKAFGLFMEDSGKSAGVSPPLILLHGMADDLHSWDEVLPGLSEGRRVIRYDLRGFGRSPHPTETYSHTDDLLQLMDGIELERADLLGVSFGGSIALHFALEHPARVRRLVLESPSMRGWDWSDDWRNLASAIEAAAQTQGVEAAKALWLRHPMFDALRAYQAAFAKMSVGLARYSGLHWLGADRHLPLPAPDIERLEQLQTPTLLISGERDVEDMRLIADAIAALSPSVQRVDFSAGHLVHLEQPEAFVKTVDAFLTAL